MASSDINRRKFLQNTALGLGALAVGTPFICARAATPTIKCGVVTSLSGENKLGGNLTRRGYDIWAEQINAQGGLEIGGDRFKVEMSYGDAKSRPATGADAATRLIVQKEVDLIFGPYTSGVTLATQPIAAKYRIPMISGSAESPNVWKAKPAMNFGMIPAVDLTTSKAIGVIAKNADPKPKTAAVVGVNEAFSKETAEGFRDGVKAAELELTSYQLIPNKADLTPVISKLKSEDPDLVAVGAHLSTLINFIKAAKSLNYRPKGIVMHYGVTAAGFAEQLKADADNVFGITLWTPNLPYKDALFGTAKEYDALYNKRWERHPDYTAAGCSASGLVLQDAVARLGKAPPWNQSDHMSLAGAIEATDIETFFGPVAFASEGDHYHNNIKPVPVVVQIRDGGVLPVAPPSAAEGELVYPLSPWS